MKRWHFPQRDRGLPVAARGEKDTSISSSMPVGQVGRSHSGWELACRFQLAHGLCDRELERRAKGLRMTLPCAQAAACGAAASSPETPRLWPPAL